MRTAIIGLPQVGKTSLFTILTGTKREARLGATSVQVGVTRVPDRRLDELAAIFQPQKLTHATVEYADVPAMSKEALRVPAYMGALRLVDAFAHVLRLFEEDAVMHVDGSVDPRRDWENVELELILNDLAVVEKRLERVEKDIGRMKDPNLAHERDLLVMAKEFLESERPLRELDLEPEESKRLSGVSSSFLKSPCCLSSTSVNPRPRRYMKPKSNTDASGCVAGRTPPSPPSVEASRRKSPSCPKKKLSPTSKATGSANRDWTG